MTKLTKEELDERIKATSAATYWEHESDMNDNGDAIRQLLRDYTESIVPEKDKILTELYEGLSEEHSQHSHNLFVLGQNKAIDTIHQNAKDLLGDTE